MRDKVFIKEIVIIRKNALNQLEYGLFDSLGFIFTSFKDLDRAIDYAIKKDIDYKIIE